nr:metalloendoproteinase 2-MMP-like [Ipomoea trifida]
MDVVWASPSIHPFYDFIHLFEFTETEMYRSADFKITWMQSGYLHMDGDEDWVLDGDFLSAPASILLRFTKSDICWVWVTRR